MTEWKDSIDTFAPVIEALDDGHITASEGGVAIFDILSNHPLYETDTDFEDIANEIGWITEMYEVDDNLEPLYDWADATAVWIRPTESL